MWLACRWRYAHSLVREEANDVRDTWGIQVAQDMSYKWPILGDAERANWRDERWRERDE